MSDFSMELNEDQLQVLRWVHDFAENVVRPAAHEWDEREETPWPIIEEAARIGLYSFDFVANCFADPTGLLFHWSTRSWSGVTRASLSRSSVRLSVSPDRCSRHSRAGGRMGSAVLRSRRWHSAHGLCVSEVDAGPDLGGMRTRAEYDAASDTWTLNGTKTWVTNGGIADIHLSRRQRSRTWTWRGWPGVLHRAAEDSWTRDGPQVPEDGYARVPHR